MLTRPITILMGILTQYNFDLTININSHGKPYIVSDTIVNLSVIKSELIENYGFTETTVILRQYLCPVGHFYILMVDDRFNRNNVIEFPLKNTAPNYHPKLVAVN